jgi:hypothetical protein
MKIHRQRIFELVAQGRMASADAERLWSAWRDERASSWMVVAAIGMAALATAHSLLAHPGTLQIIRQVLGGLL